MNLVDWKDVVMTLTEVRSADGTTIAVDVNGSGASIVLVCGAATSRTMNAALANELADGFTVFNYDRRGRGDSSDTMPYAPQREYEDLSAVIDAAGGSAAVFGSSSGAQLVVGAAAEGVSMAAAVLWEPPYFLPGSRDFPADYLERLTAMLAENRYSDVVEYFLSAAVGLPAEMIAGVRESSYWTDTVALAPTIAYDAEIGGDGRPDPRLLSRVTVPVLIADGGSWPWLAEGADAASALIPASRRVTLAGQSHDFDPRVLAGAIREFLGTVHFGTS